MLWFINNLTIYNINICSQISKILTINKFNLKLGFLKLNVNNKKYGF